jgi:hypothetical protein
MVKDQIKSELFAPFYYPEDPDPYKDDVELYRRYGFYWPTKEDIIQLSKDHENFSLDDFYIRKIRWKKEGCGFTMLQLEFQDGILSPIFAPRKPDLSMDNYYTSVFKPGVVRSVRINVPHEENKDTKKIEKKYIEKLQFLNFNAKDMDVKDKIDKKDPRVLCQADACRCGVDETFEVPKGYRIVGLFGLTATDKYCWDDTKVRELDIIRAIGFICMKYLF